MEDRVLRNLQTLRESRLPVFVSTPDLLVDVPWAKWCPIVIDSSRWRREGLRSEGRLRVMHGPTYRLMKGTDLILPILRQLGEEGLVELDLVEGVPHTEMEARLGRTDIVLDQFALGSYGALACESMAAGRVVVGHVSDQARQAVLEASGRRLPIVEATPDSLEGVLRNLHDDREALVDVASRGPGFVEAVHDGRLSVVALSTFLGRDVSPEN